MCFLEGKNPAGMSAFCDSTSVRLFLMGCSVLIYFDWFDREDLKASPRMCCKFFSKTLLKPLL